MDFDFYMFIFVIWFLCCLLFECRGFVFVIFKIIDGVKRVMEDSNKIIEVSDNKL